MKKKHFKGWFELKNGKIELITENKNVSFEEHEKGLILLRDEINRLLANKQNCPFYNGKLKPKKNSGNSCSCSNYKK